MAGCHSDEKRLLLRGGGTLVFCLKCRSEKPLSLFHRTKKSKSGIRQPCAACRSTKRPRPPKACKSCGRTGCDFTGTSLYCRPCWNFRRRKRRTPRDKINKRDMTLRRRYGITQAEYDAMLQRQGGKCLICRRMQDRRPLAVDHHHESNRVRGLLCYWCNSIL